MAHSIKIEDVPAYLKEHKKTNGDETVDLVKNIAAYLRTYKVSPKHYTIMIEPGESWIMIQIDEQCGFVDRQVSKSKFEFINGTCFSIDIVDIPSMNKI